MPLFGPKKKKVVVAEERTGPMERTIYDYRDMDVDISGHEREVDGRDVPVRPYTQRRRVREGGEEKPGWLGLRRKRRAPEPSLIEQGGEAADRQADLMEK